MTKQKTDLYRHYNKSGKLLYVGISNSAIYRLQQHRSGSHWYDEIANVTIEKFPDRTAALNAEFKAIQTEKPAHNIDHNGSKPNEDLWAKLKERLSFFKYRYSGRINAIKYSFGLIKAKQSRPVVYSRDSLSSNLLDVHHRTFDEFDRALRACFPGDDLYFHKSIIWPNHFIRAFLLGVRVKKL
jgi:predicted GIY-YIG superfamily endonuclease